MKHAIFTAIACLLLVSSAQAFSITGGERLGRRWTVSGRGGTYGFVEFIAGNRSGTFVHYGRSYRFVRLPFEVVAGSAAAFPLFITIFPALVLLVRRREPISRAIEHETLEGARNGEA